MSVDQQIPPLAPPPPPLDSSGVLQQFLDRVRGLKEPPKGWRGWPVRVGRFFYSIRLETWLAVGLFVVLALAVLLAWWRFHQDADNDPWSDRFGWQTIATLVSLVFVIPLVVRRAVAETRRTAVTPFADLDAEWQRGLDLLRVNGVSLERLPVFVVLGSKSASRDTNLLGAAGEPAEPIGTAGREATLQWFQSRRALYLVVRRVGSLALVDDAAFTAGSLRDAHRSVARLHRMVELLRRTRDPRTPLNGVLLQVDFRVLGDESLRAVVAKAARNDLAGTLEFSGLDVPVTLVLLGIERTSGYDEFRRLVGPAGFQTRTFGVSLPVPAVADDAACQAVARQACRDLQRGVGEVLRTRWEDAVTAASLYGLLATMRSRTHAQLGSLLTRVFATQVPPGTPVPRLAGCRLGGADGTATFVGGVLDEQWSRQSQIEWGPDGRRRANRRRLAVFGGILLSILLVGLAVLQLTGPLPSRRTTSEVPPELDAKHGLELCARTDREPAVDSDFEQAEVSRRPEHEPGTG